jgi:hypothetical protein
MRNSLVVWALWILIAGLGRSQSAYASNDTVCDLLMATSTTPFAELLSPPAATIYTRTHSRHQEGSSEPVKVAVLTADQYSPELDGILEKLGYFGVAIRDPESSVIDARADFHLVPEWVRWVMKAPKSVENWIEGLGPSDARNQMKRKLKKSRIPGEEVRVEIAPLTIGDYALWHKTLYVPEILTKPGAIPAWTAEKFGDHEVVRTNPGQLVPDFERVFFYSKTGELIGGALVSTDKAEESLTIRAAAFEAAARAKFELAVRGMEEVITLGAARGAKIISYGTDPNLYGVDSIVGLERFKASIGMQAIPSPMGKTQLLKIFASAHPQLGSVQEGEGYQGVVMFAYQFEGIRSTRYEVLSSWLRPPSELSTEIKAERAMKHMRVVQVGAAPGSNEIKVPKGMEPPVRFP